MSALLPLCLLGCDPAREPFDLPTGACGAEPHDWLGPDEVGEVVAWEAVPEWSLDAGAIRGLVALAGFGSLDVPHGARVYRLRYTSQDRGERVEATALVAFPDADVEVPTALWLHQATGFSDRCAPSGGDLMDAGPAIVLAGLGFAVVAPDYLGMNGFGPPSEGPHPYAVPEPTAVVSLDALRAAWRFAETEPSVPSRASRRTVVWGQSQGGHAGQWVDRYAPRYLPEAELAAVVLGIPATDLTAMMEAATSRFAMVSVGMPFVLHAASQWYGTGDVDEVITEAFRDELDRTLGECVTLVLPEGFEAVEDVYRPAFLAADGVPEPWRCMLDAASVERAPFPREHDAPVLWVTGTADDVVIHAVQEASRRALCEQGWRIEALTCDGGGHTETGVGTLRRQLDWVRARLAGEPLGPTCVDPVPADCGG